MAIDKAIVDYSLITDGLKPDDLFLVQRGSTYRSLESTSIGGGLFKNQVEISIAQMSLISTAPVLLVEDPGSNKFVQVICVSTTRKGMPYTTADSALSIRYITSLSPLFSSATDFLTKAGSLNINDLSSGASGLTILDNKGIEIYALSDPTVVTGEVSVNILYRIVSI